MPKRTGLDPERVRQQMQKALSEPPSSAFFDALESVRRTEGVTDFIRFGINRLVGAMPMGRGALTAAALSNWISRPGHDVVVNGPEMSALRALHRVEGNFDALAQVALDQMLPEDEFPDVEAMHRGSDDSIILYASARFRPSFYRELTARNNPSQTIELLS